MDNTAKNADGQEVEGAIGGAAALSTAREAAEAYTAAGLACVMLRPGEKRPTYPGWSSTKTPFEMYSEGSGVGILTGSVSDGGVPGRSLVGIDIDNPDAIPIVHEELAAEGIVSGMVDGRAGKPESHIYLLTPNDSIPPEEVASGRTAAVAAAEREGRHPGPRKRCWRDANKKPVAEILACGQQIAAPPTMHASGEQRKWKGGARGEPAVAPYPRILSAIARAMSRCDATLAGNKNAPDDTGDEGDEPDAKQTEADAERIDAVPESERERRCVAYLAGVPDSDLPETGRGGEHASHRLARIAVNDFALGPDAALRVLMQHIEPRLGALGLEQWGEGGWRMRVEKAAGASDPRFPRGCKLRGAVPSNGDDVPRQSGDPTRIGAMYNTDVEKQGRRYVVKLDQVYRDIGGVYAPEFDGTFDDDVRAYLERYTAHVYRICLRTWESDLARLRAAIDEQRPVAMAEASAEAEKRKKSKKKAPTITVLNEKNAPARTRLLKLERQLERELDNEPKCETVTRHKVSEVAAAARSQRRVRDNIQPGERFDRKPERGVACANGWLNFDTWQLEPHDPAARFTLARLNTGYDPAATAPTWEALLNEWTGGDAELKAVLQEVAGATLDANLTVAHFTMLPGEAATGKSTFLHVLRQVLDPANVSAVPLDQFSTHRFAMYGLLGKFANVVADPGFFASNDEGVLKQLTSFTDEVQFEAKNKQPIIARNTAKIICAANTLPTFRDNSDGVWRRAIVAPFRFIVPVEKRDPKYGTAEFWAAELPGVLNWMLAGLRRLHAAGRFTASAVCDAAKRAHREDSDPLRTFVAEALAAEPGGFASNREIASALRQWCGSNSYPKLAEASAITVNRAIARAFPDAQKGKDRDGTGGGPVHGWKGLRLLTTAKLLGTSGRDIVTTR